MDSLKKSTETVMPVQRKNRTSIDRVTHQWAATKPSGGICRQTHGMLAGSVRGKREFAFGAVSSGHDNFLIRILHFHQHSHPRYKRMKLTIWKWQQLKLTIDFHGSVNLFPPIRYRSRQYDTERGNMPCVTVIDCLMCRFSNLPCPPPVDWLIVHNNTYRSHYHLPAYLARVRIDLYSHPKIPLYISLKNSIKYRVLDLRTICRPAGSKETRY